MLRTLKGILLITFSLVFLVGCDLADDVIDILLDDSDAETSIENESQSGVVTALSELKNTDNFLPNALAHILEGELNRKGNAVGFHYDRLPTKKGEIIAGTETNTNYYGVYEAMVKVDGVSKTSNSGKSTFFPDEWDTQDVVDAINEAYDNRSLKTGNTYAGLTKDGLEINMYLTQDDKIISAFPIY